MTHTQFRPDPEERLFSYILEEGLFVTGGASNNGGKVLEWVQSAFYPDLEISEIIDLALAVAPGAEGLLFVPYLHGERAPVWDAGATGQLHGLRHHHRRQHIARAALEGVLYNLYASLQHLDTLGDAITEIFANGGFTRSEGWVQILADLSGLPVHVAETPQASAYGAVLMARKGTGDLATWAELKGQLPRDKSIAPDTDRQVVYTRCYDRFLSLIF
jgi:gluconokinase